MSTRSIIARTTGEGTFAGRYHHWDSYPSALGVTLVDFYRGFYQHDLNRMLRVLLDEHPAGWSTLNQADFNLTPGYSTEGPQPKCYCHGERHEEGWVADEKSDCGAEWAYVFDEGKKVLHILEARKHKRTHERYWAPVGTIRLDSPKTIDWAAIECGKKLERCSHYAWYHNLQPKTSNLSARTYLGYQPLEFHDAIAFIISGKRYKATGSGGHSDFLRRFGKTQFPVNTWVATVAAQNGRRLEVSVASITKDGYEPLDNVVWVYPPTKKNRHETRVWGGKR